MGEIAESLINGEFDYETGEYIGEPCGYPRRYGRKKNYNNYRSGITKYLRRSGIEDKNHFKVLKKFCMENKTSINHENGNDANRLLAAVNSVFTRHKPFFRFSGVFLKYKIGCEKYWVKVYPIEQHNLNCKGLHVCRVDTEEDDNVYYVKPENLVKWLQSVKKHLEWKRDLYKKQLKAETEQEYNSIELARFMGSQF